ncbi:repetitive organellar protein-like [Harmonia axyridis]|uniref:repetitive organellar protein-like n=1 Tax=Harmonia axyridis TaxID=115357 RepID=UPI001E278830|nr:repetitive organellar protein-like [Harmonia axyridis]
MLGHQDEITASYRKCCSDLKEKLKIRLTEIYDNCKDRCQDDIATNHEKYIDDNLDPLVYFERNLLQYIRIKKHYQNENKTLQMKIKELQLDLRSKDVCIFKLKEDIVSHFMQIEFLRRHNEKLENDLLNSRKKINQFEKSKDWLRERIFSIHSNTNYELELIYPEKLNKTDNNCDKEKEKRHSYFSEVKAVEECETIDEFRKFYGKLMEVYHENIFLKRTLQKMKSLSDREQRLNNILKSNHGIPTVPKLEDIQNDSHKLNTDSVDKKKNENKQILELNSIIDCMKLTVLQLEFEKRNMELSVFKIREYFMEMKNIQTKLKLMLSDKNYPFNLSVLKSGVSSSDASKNSSFDTENIIEELVNSIRNLKLEKLQMEIEHHEELSTFTEKFSRMQYFLQSIKDVCNNTSNDEELTLKSGSTKITSKNTIFVNDKVESSSISDIELSSSGNNIEISTKVSPNKIAATNEDIIVKKTSNAIPQYIIRRMKLFEEQYERIISTCSKNLVHLKELNDTSSISHLRKMKVLALVKEKQLTEQRNRFEKYKRSLLSTLKHYKQCNIAKTRQYDELQEQFIPIFFQLKFLKNYFTAIEKHMPNSSSIDHKQQSKIIEVMEKIGYLTENIEKNIGPKVIKLGMSATLNPDLQIASLPKIQMEIKAKKKPLNDSYYIRQEKLSLINSNPENPIRDEDISNKNDETHSKEIDIQKTHIEKLKRENSQLQSALRQRDHLLGTIVKSFKRKLDGVAMEINDKYFLQRLCNDLRSVIKIYGGQNRIMKEALENNNIRTKSIYIQNTLRRNSKIDTEEHIRQLMKQQTEFCRMKETFTDIQSHLESMKKDVSLLQNVINKR